MRLYSTHPSLCMKLSKSAIDVLHAILRGTRVSTLSALQSSGRHLVTRDQHQAGSRAAQPRIKAARGLVSQLAIHLRRKNARILTRLRALNKGSAGREDKALPTRSSVPQLGAW